MLCAAEWKSFAIVLISAMGLLGVTDASAARPADEKSLTGEEGFQPLFAEDGEPRGWVVRHWADVSQPAQEGTQWMVKQGILHGGEPRGSWLISEKTYANFELKFEFKLGERGNSGCALRAPLTGDPAFDGLELQMADLRYNPEAQPNELTGGIYRVLTPRRQVYRPTEWNAYHVRLAGNQLTVVLNGETIIDCDLSQQTQTALRHNGEGAPPLSDRPRSGHIGFQELSRGGDHVQIRNARLRELP